jgi:hypothetical protein
MAPQLGHLPFLPAMLAGVRTELPHRTQWNSMVSDDSAGAMGLRPTDASAGRSLRESCGSVAADAAGIVNTVPQPGHFPFLPAMAAAMRTGRPHCGQGNSILSSAPPGDPDGSLRGFGALAGGLTGLGVAVD